MELILSGKKAHGPLANYGESVWAQHKCLLLYPQQTNHSLLHAKSLLSRAPGVNNVSIKWSWSCVRV